MFKDTSFKLYTKLLLFVIIFSLGLGFSNRFLNNNQTKTSHIEEKKPRNGQKSIIKNQLIIYTKYPGKCIHRYLKAKA